MAWSETAMRYWEVHTLLTIARRKEKHGQWMRIEKILMWYECHY